MNSGVDADCREAIEDGRRSCFSERALSEEERLTLRDDGNGAAGSNQSARIESKRNRLLQAKMTAAASRCEVAGEKVREICREANESFKEALKSKETAFNSDLAQRQTVTSYAYQAATRLLEDAVTCTRRQNEIYKNAANGDASVSVVSGSNEKLNNPVGESNSHEQNEHEHTPGQREIHGLVHATGEATLSTGGKMVEEMAQRSTVKMGARAFASAVGPVSIVTAEKDDVTGPAVTASTMAAEAAGVGIRPALFGGLFGTVLLHTTPAGVRCDGVFNPVEAAAKNCPYNSNWGAQSIESAARLMDHKP